MRGKEGRGEMEVMGIEMTTHVIHVYVLIHPLQVVAMEDGLLRSYLTLSNITLTNGGKYNCDLKGEKQFSIPTMIEVDDSKID